MELLLDKLKRLAKESEDELREIGLGDKLKSNITYTINYRAKKRFGQCCDKKDINISSWLLEIGSDEDIKNTIIHEILHTFSDAVGHGAKWQYYANYVNARTKYKISRCGSINEVYQKANKVRPTTKVNYNWEITCRQCGATWKKQKMLNRTLVGYKYHSRYHISCGCHDLQVKNLKSGEIVC